MHEARLPWQRGAAFFFRHLLDGDPASSTLSWRWVAGLQTPGKTYLARRSNLEKYLASQLLDSLSDGLAAFENPQALQPEPISQPGTTRPDWPVERLTSSPATGLWIHEEDLAIETSSLKSQSFSAILVTGDADIWNHHQFPLIKRQWITDALRDAATRAELIWKAPTSVENRTSTEEAIVAWAIANKLDQVAAMRPGIGPIHDSLSKLRAALACADVRLVLMERAGDVNIRHFASGGFFQFWERVKKTLVTSPGGHDSLVKQQLTIDFPQ